MKTFTPYEDPIPKMSTKKMKIEFGLICIKLGRKYTKFSVKTNNDLHVLCLAMYNNGFKDGVKAHKKEASKHANEILDYFGI